MSAKDAMVKVQGTYRAEDMGGATGCCQPGSPWQIEHCTESPLCLKLLLALLPVQDVQLDILPVKMSSL